MLHDRQKGLLKMQKRWCEWNDPAQHVDRPADRKADLVRPCRRVCRAAEGSYGESNQQQFSDQLQSGDDQLKPVVVIRDPIRKKPQQALPAKAAEHTAIEIQQQIGRPRTFEKDVPLGRETDAATGNERQSDRKGD